MKHQAFSIGLIAGALLIGSPSTKADSFAVPANQDTFITEHGGYGGQSSAHGNDIRLVMVRAISGLHRSFPVLSFDLSSFTGKTVTSPTSDLTVYLRSGWGKNHVTQSVSVRESLVAWDASSATWANFGGTGFNPQAHTGKNLQTQHITYHGRTEPVTFSLPSALVQRWIDSPESNNGLFLISNTTAMLTDMSIWSNEGGPVSTLSFDAVPEPKSAALILLLFPVMVARRHLCQGNKRKTGKLYFHLNPLLQWLYMKPAYRTSTPDKWV